MIDNFALVVSHALILLAAWRLIRRPDLDDDDAAPGAGGRAPWFKRTTREDT